MGETLTTGLSVEETPELVGSCTDAVVDALATVDVDGIDVRPPVVVNVVPPRPLIELIGVPEAAAAAASPGPLMNVCTL